MEIVFENMSKLMRFSVYIERIFKKILLVVYRNNNIIAACTHAGVIWDIFFIENILGKLCAFWCIVCLKTSLKMNIFYIKNNDCGDGIRI